MPTREEWEELQKKGESREKVQAIRYQRQAQIQVGQQARTVVDHPGWQTFIDHLEQMRNTVDARIGLVTTQLSDSEELGDALAKLKLELRGLKGEKRGLDYALELIPKLITAGETAAVVEKNLAG